MKKNSVALVSGAPGFSNKIDMRNLVTIQKRFHNDIHIYRLDPPSGSSGSNGLIYHTLMKPWGKGDNLLLRILGILFLELHSLLVLLKLPKDVKYVFFLQSTQLFIPALFALKGRAKLVKITTRDYSKRNIRPFVELVYSLSDIIVVYSPSMVKQLDIEKHAKKIIVWNYNYVGREFKKTSPVKDRYEIGYIGRLAPEKNIDKIIESAKLLGITDKFLIGGSGQSYEIVKSMCETEGVKFIGKIPHYKMPYYLNRLKILILPSDTEGFPKIVTEAMACGTIVLATPVGGIQDAVLDGETGFLLDNVSRETIVKRIREILSRDDLGIISSNARDKIMESFSYDKALKVYSQFQEDN